MRTIKFRARRKNGEWVVGNFIHHFATYFNTEEHYSIFLPKPENDNGGYWVDSIDRNTIGQFSGLYDKNGKGIYEGDIVRIFDHQNCQVIFERGAFCYVTKYSIMPFSSNTNLHIGENGACPEVEIVGNIHDNPGLLEGGEK